MAAPDEAAPTEAALRFAASVADVVVCTGGLGPTEDDVNREVFAAVFGCRLVTDARALEMMRERFAARGHASMPEHNARQALVPEGATVFQNRWGTAPGYFLPPAAERGVAAEGGTVAAALVALPGPPREMMPMFESDAEPLLRARSAGAGFVRTRTLHTFGRPESSINACTRDLFRRDPGVIFTLLAKPYGVDIRITARGATPEEMIDRLDRFERLVVERVGEEDLYGRDEETLQAVAGRMLLERGESVATAESCTGGLLAKLLTDQSGSSAWFGQGWVTYSNEAKERLLGVGRETLERFGAVSRETAREMALRARELSGAAYALSITGIAGPTGGTPEKPVGLVYIGLADRDGVVVSEQRFLSDRDHNRLLSALTALDMLRRRLLRGPKPVALPSSGSYGAARA